ncbi:uncharacterized protein LOC111347158 [Stylophora pistillata]|uniref:uncharacterized protein LOC111347158 n=1 Tax=Stylophora pistillata TaxID=50429 RepID=UPI000C056471|nr:uncharacterized protein LOC111347158 [Stylophora pistillata]
MADDGEITIGTPLSSKRYEPRSPVSFIASPLYFPNEITRVPLQRIRCGKLDIKSEERWLEYQPQSKHLRFLHKDRKHLDHEQCTLLDCQNISAADLRVSAKFGYLDPMKGTLIVECQNLVQGDSPHCGAGVASCSYVVEATFHVNYTGQVRDVLRSLRHAKLLDSSDGETPSREGEGERAARVCRERKLREGLPDWTPYIPHRVYSPAVRGLIESVITLYTIFSILWALWQLHRHVDFIRAYMQPIIDALKYHVQLMDECIHFLNGLFEELTEQWLAYVKPGYVILSSFASPLIAVGREMWFAVVSFSTAFAVIFRPLYLLFQPILNILHMVFIKTPYAVFQPMFSFASKCWSLFYNTVFYRLVLTQISNIKQVFIWLVEILEKSMKLDPFKAQLVLMRSTVINSGKALSLGLVFIFKSIERRVWLMIARPVEDKDD